VQPLIENAIIHGYEQHKLRPGYCGLTAERFGQICLVRVIDRGGGMDRERKEMYNRVFDGSYTGDETELPFQRIGLLNVHHRIRLVYGEPYGLHIEKSDAEGTIIQLKLPYRKEANQD
jgi:two-component system sensor histidine kinase YesM